MTGRGGVGAVAGVALTIVGVLALGFVADVALLGPVWHARDQHVAYADLRVRLAEATAPVGPAHPGTPVAVLRIPQLGLDEVVFEGTAAGVLFSGPGHRRDTPLPGQSGTSVIMGRRGAYGAPFRNLAGLVRGDVFTVVTGQGEHTYRVLGVRKAGDPQPPVPATTEGRLTLVTADGSALLPTGALRVDALLTSAAKPRPAQAVRTDQLTAGERPLAADPAAWMAIVLWGQLLVLATGATVWARLHWGRWQTWLTAGPVLVALGLAVADQVSAALLPNLL